MSPRTRRDLITPEYWLCLLASAAPFTALALALNAIGVSTEAALFFALIFAVITEHSAYRLTVRVEARRNDSDGDDRKVAV
jgi:membrane protein implicated in regulation of membrane protease activity